MADIIRTYHDVTDLEINSALSKVKDVMDLSSGTEFFSVLKDPLSIIPTVNSGEINELYDDRDRLVKVGNQFSYYMHIGDHYKYECASGDDLDIDEQGLSFTADINITKLEYESIVIAEDQQDRNWVKNAKSIMHHARSVTLRSVAVDGGYTWRFYFSNMRLSYAWDSGIIMQEAHPAIPFYSPPDVSSDFIEENWQFYIDASDLRIMEFDLEYIETKSKFYYDDFDEVFSHFKRCYTSRDFANTLFLTQKVPNHFSINISGLRYNSVDDLISILIGILDYNYSYNSANTIVEFLNSELGIDESTDTFLFSQGEPGVIKMYDTRLVLLARDHPEDIRKILEKYCLSGEDFILFSDVNEHAVSFIIHILQYMGVAENVTKHSHSSRQLFVNPTFETITHPYNKDLIIGNRNNPAYISFVEDIDFNNCELANIGNIASAGNMNFVSGWVATLSSNNITTTNLTVNQTLSVNNLSTDEVEINKNVIKQVGSATGTDSVHGMPLLVFQIENYLDNNGTVLTGSSINNATKAKGVIRQTKSTFDTSTTIATGGVNNANNHKFLGIDGEFRALTPQYLGASDTTHGHGNITNDGKVTTNKSGLVSNDRILIADSGDGGRVKTGPAFTQDGNSNTDNTTNTDPNRKYLSQTGYWKSPADMLFRSTLTQLASVDGATSFGIHRIDFHGVTGGYKFDNSDGTYGLPLSDANGSTFDGQVGSFDKNYHINYGLLLVLPSNGEFVNAASADIIQVIYPEQLMDSGTTYLPYIFIRSGSQVSGSMVWNRWTTFSLSNHTHNKEYARINQDGTRVAGNITILGSGEASSADSFYTANYLTGGSGVTKHDYYKIEFTNGDANNSDKVTNNLSGDDNTGSYSWKIGNNSSLALMELSRDASKKELNLQNETNLNVTGTTKFDKSVSLNSSNNASINLARPGSGTSLSTVDNIMVLADAGSGSYRTLKYLDITATDLYNLTGEHGTVNTINTNLTNHYSSSAANDAHGNLKSNGTVAGTDATIDNGDKLLIGHKNSSNKYELAKTNIEFNGSTTTEYLSKKGSWEKIPGVWSTSLVSDVWTADNTTNYTTTNGGLISKTDIEHLAAMWSVWEADVDAANTKIDRVKEMLKAFENLNEDSDLAGIITGLNTDISGKLSLTGGTMTGLITTKTGTTHTGIKVGDTYITAINGNLILQNNGAIRFGPDDWAYSKWAGLSYDATNKIVNLGIADNDVFVSNATGYTDGKLYLPGINAAYLGKGTTQLVTTVSTSGTGLSGGVTAANATGTITLDSSSAGNAGANKVILRNAAGSIQSEKYAISSGTTTKATMQYNSTEDCIDFIFA